MQNAIRLMERGLAAPGRSISHHFPLSEIHAAMAAMESPERNKVMIHP